MRLVSILLPVLLLASLLAASTLLRPTHDFKPRPIALTAERIVPRGLIVRPPLHFVAGWKVSSSEPNFGGISALARQAGGFIALSDAGTLIRFSLNRNNQARATIASIPKACGLDAARTSRDAESLVRGRAGALWIGFEWDNRICAIDGSGVRLARPRAMQGWPITYGAESMARLADGRIFVIAERRSLSRTRIAPGLIFEGDPARPGTRTLGFGYRLLDDYRATDAALLPDGKLLILERRHDRLFSFPGKLKILSSNAVAANTVVAGRTLLQLGPPDLDQNFEAVAVSQAGGRTFVWLMSDDNFLPVQQTMLLLFEYRG